MFIKKRKMCPKNFNLMVQNGPTKKLFKKKGIKINVPAKF